MNLRPVRVQETNENFQRKFWSYLVWDWVQEGRSWRQSRELYVYQNDLMEMKASLARMEYARGNCCRVYLFD